MVECLEKDDSISSSRIKRIRPFTKRTMVRRHRAANTFRLLLCEVQKLPLDIDASHVVPSASKRRGNVAPSYPVFDDTRPTRKT